MTEVLMNYTNETLNQKIITRYAYKILKKGKYEKIYKEIAKGGVIE